MTFERIGGLTVAHIGQLWERLPSTFAHVEEVDPLATTVELPGTPGTAVSLDPAVMRAPRVWFMTSAKDRLIQFQRDRFLYNWRRTAAEQPYPRYRAVSDGFYEHLGTFGAYVQDRFQSELRFRQYELSYVNHIPVDGAWHGLADIANVFPDLSWRATESRFLPAPEALVTHLAFSLPEQSGRLHVRIQNVERQTDHQPILMFDLTARGYSANMRKWFETAHEWIVRGFADLTQGTAQESEWRRVY
ncbi:MAG: TIGR04255 family protein [Polyangiaceae bacterium]|nr:TIGR04255 family protein [Polyangiaceae bacterium]